MRYWLFSNKAFLACFLALMVIVSLAGQIQAAAASAEENPQQTIATLLERLDHELTAYHEELQAAGEAEFAERKADLEELLSQEWDEFYSAAQEEGKDFAKWLQDEYGKKLLRLQLELLLVNLTEEEEGERLAAIATLQETMDQLRSEKEAELQTRLDEYQVSLEERFAQLTSAVSDEITTRLTQEYAAFKDDFVWAFENTLRNYSANR